jgi:addiction module HigA family antidote
MTDFPPTHPGEVLREDVLKPLGLSRYRLAKALGVPEVRVSAIVNGKRAVTPRTARPIAAVHRSLTLPVREWRLRRSSLGSGVHP